MQRDRVAKGRRQSLLDAEAAVARGLNDRIDHENVCFRSALMPGIQEGEALWVPAPTLCSDDEAALLEGRPRVHISSAVEMIIDLSGGPDHAPIQENIESRSFEISFCQCP